MDRIFDEMARILARQMPRRQAFRLLGGALAAGIVGAFGTRSASAQTCSPACPGGQKCCPGGPRTFCAPTANTCCGNKSCAAGLACCEGSCCKAGQTCTRGRCTASAA